jgi:hypothetical protein
MIGDFNDALNGWEILCDQCKINIIGYVGDQDKPLDTEYFGSTCVKCWEQNNPIENIEPVN